MVFGNVVATVIGLVALGGLAWVGPVLFRLPQFGLPPVASTIGYLCAATIALACLTTAVAMLAGIASDWSEPAKKAMIVGWVLTVPAVLAAVGLAFVAMTAPASAQGYLLARAIPASLILGLPALIMVVLAVPGRP